MRLDLSQKVILPLLGAACVLTIWSIVSVTVAPDLPSPGRTWRESRRYVLEPFFKDGEMNQGIGRLAAYSLLRVGKGYLLALLIGTPIGFMLGLSRKLRHVRSDHPVPAADLAAGVAAARPRDLPPVRARRRLHDRAVRDVADGHQRGRRCALDQPGPPQRRPGAPSVAVPHAHED